MTTRIRLNQLDTGGVNSVGNNQQDFTANHVVILNDAVNTMTNLGAVVGITFTLPDVTSVLGKSFLFVKLSASSLTIQTFGTDSIANKGTLVTNSLATELASYLRLAAIKTGPTTGLWIMNDAFGSWTIS